MLSNQLRYVPLQYYLLLFILFYIYVLLTT